LFSLERTLAVVVANSWGSCESRPSSGTPSDPLALQTFASVKQWVALIKNGEFLIR
jgi:hypothetical protein